MVKIWRIQNIWITNDNITKENVYSVLLRHRSKNGFVLAESITVLLVNADTGRVRQSVSDVMLFVDSVKQVSHGARGIHWDVLRAVCLIQQRNSAHLAVVVVS